MGSSVRAAIASTVSAPGPPIVSFVDYHQSIGFELIILFSDGPPDESLLGLEGRHGVRVVQRGASLEGQWARLPSFPSLMPFLAREVMARQILNAELAVGLALELDMQWLLHLDADELLHTNGRSVADHFCKVSQSGATEVVYANHEAVPEVAEVGDYFREVTLFKTNPKYLRTQVSGLPYIAYKSGKAATLLASMPRPHGVHRFRATAIAHRSVLSRSAQILHYPCCGYGRFIRKYELLGLFSDAWFGQLPIAEHMPFHAKARDLVAAGRMAECRTLYNQRVMLSGISAVQRQQLLTDGVLQRIVGPADKLDAIAAARNARAGV